jgi:hypothetical protein
VKSGATTEIIDLSVATTASLIRSWRETLELMESGGLADDEIELVRHQLPIAIEDGIARLKNGANRDDEEELIRVLSQVGKALERVLAVRRLVARVR